VRDLARLLLPIETGASGSAGAGDKINHFNPSSGTNFTVPDEIAMSARYNGFFNMRTEILTQEDSPTPLARRHLDPPRVMTGRERRHMNPDRGWIKLCERYLDMMISRFVYPLVGEVWHPYSWLLEHRFALAETKLSPAGWPRGLAPVRVLLISDIHTGIFLKPETLWQLVHALMQTKPDLVAIGAIWSPGTPAKQRLSRRNAFGRGTACGAWFCFGNDYFGGRAAGAAEQSRGHRHQNTQERKCRAEPPRRQFVVGGIDDLLFGKPDGQECWRARRRIFYWRTIPTIFTKPTRGGSAPLSDIRMAPDSLLQWSGDRTPEPLLSRRRCTPIARHYSSSRAG
jgi:hypothetical protein